MQGFSAARFPTGVPFTRCLDFHELLQGAGQQEGKQQNLKKPGGCQCEGDVQAAFDAEGFQNHGCRKTKKQAAEKEKQHSEGQKKRNQRKEKRQQQKKGTATEILPEGSPEGKAASRAEKTGKESHQLLFAAAGQVYFEETAGGQADGCTEQKQKKDSLIHIVTLPYQSMRSSPCHVEKRLHNLRFFDKFQLKFFIQSNILEKHAKNDEC